MSGGGKKYNIWIAYSDLFTNLSTFLFISALGVFAAIGSGVLASVGEGSDVQCRIPTEISDSLTNGSIMTPLGDGGTLANDRDGCVEYYRVDGYRYGSADLASFRDMSGARPKPDDLSTKLCQPIWLTLALQKFDDAEAQISFIGIGEANAKPAYPGKCSASQSDDPQLAGFPDRRKRSAISTISECQISGVGAYPVCRELLACLSAGPDDRNEWCRSVRAAVNRARLSEVACAKQVPELQAKALYDSCEGAPLKLSFPTQLFATDAMVKAARNLDDRRALWRRVGIDAVIRDGPMLASPSTNDVADLVRNQPSGTVVVGVYTGGRRN